VGFADGTALTVTSRRPAATGVLLMWSGHQRVLLHHYAREGGDLVLTFRRAGVAGGVELVALGLDQPS
jgi:hypothetical protein